MRPTEKRDRTEWEGIPGRNAINIIARDMRVISPSLPRVYPFVVERGEGVHLFDVDGNRFLDFAAGAGIMNLGYQNPEVTRAASEQIRRLIHSGSSNFYAELPVRFAEKLTELTGYEQVLFTNSGSEALEAAAKLAVWHARKRGLISFYKCIHRGRMLDLPSTTREIATGGEDVPGIEIFRSLYAYCYRCPLKREYPECGIECLNEVEDLLADPEIGNNVAGIMVEPIQYESGCIVPPDEFHRGLRRICDEHEILLIADELVTGAYRTGPFLGMESFNTRAEITAMAGSIGGGLPLGATLSHTSIMNLPPGTHTGTAGGNLVALRAGLAGIEEMKREDIGKSASKLGAAIVRRLREMQEDYPPIGDVRGRGLMIGVEIINPDKSPAPLLRDAIIEEAFEAGLILLPAGDSTIAITPPLTIREEEAETGLNILENAIQRLKR